MLDRERDAGLAPGDVLGSMEQVLGDVSTAPQTRRRLMTRAAAMLATGGTLAMPAVAGAAGKKKRDHSKGHDHSIVSVLATFESFGVTLLTAAVGQAKGTKSEPYAPVLAAAATTEFLHLEALRKVQGVPLTSKFWIPDAIFDGGSGLFDAIAAQEEVEISTYLAGITDATTHRNATLARLYAEALGTEAEHRVLARFASATIRGSADVPNDRAFESYPYETAKQALSASQKAGIGYGKQTAAPGKFYDFPGDPRKSGAGTKVGVINPT